MWVRNTSSYPTDEVRDLVRFATRDINMKGVCVNVKGKHNGMPWDGTAYNHVPRQSNAPSRARYLVTLRVAPDPDLFPWHRRGYNPLRRDDGFGLPPADLENGRWPVNFCADWREAIVWAAAHEAKHVEQYRERLPLSEVRTEWFAHKMLKLYRKEVRNGTG